MIAKATRDTQRQRGGLTRAIMFLRSPFAAIRARRAAIEAARDAYDMALAREILAKGETPIPHAEVMRRHGF